MVLFISNTFEGVGGGGVYERGDLHKELKYKVEVPKTTSTKVQKQIRTSSRWIKYPGSVRNGISILDGLKVNMLYFFSFFNSKGRIPADSF